MIWLLIAAVVLVNAAFAVIGTISHRRLSARIAALNATPDVSHRYVQPADTVDRYPAYLPSEVDIVGAWAAEQERLGITVSDEEIETQRRMWAAEV